MRFRLRDIAISIKVGLAPGFVLCTLIGMALVAIAIMVRLDPKAAPVSRRTPWRARSQAR